MDALTHPSQWLNFFPEKLLFSRTRKSPDCLAYVRDLVSVFDLCEWDWQNALVSFAFSCVWHYLRRRLCRSRYAIRMTAMRKNGERNQRKHTKLQQSLTCTKSKFRLNTHSLFFFLFARRFFLSYFHHRRRRRRRCRSQFSWSYSVCGACACARCVRIYSLFVSFFFFFWPKHR